VTASSPFADLAHAALEHGARVRLAIYRPDHGEYYELLLWCPPTSGCQRCGHETLELPVAGSRTRAGVAELFLMYVQVADAFSDPLVAVSHLP
jgi:hypothetical protein